MPFAALGMNLACNNRPKTIGRFSCFQKTWGIVESDQKEVWPLRDHELRCVCVCAYVQAYACKSFRK